MTRRPCHPMITKIVELCNKRGSSSARACRATARRHATTTCVHVKNGFTRPKRKPSARMRRAAEDFQTSTSAISTPIFSQNLDDAENICRGRVRSSSTSCSIWSLHGRDAGPTATCRHVPAARPKEEQMRQVLLDTGAHRSFARWKKIHLHALPDRSRTVYHRLSPCRFQTTRSCESRWRHVRLREPATWSARPHRGCRSGLLQGHQPGARDWVKEKRKCPSCLSPCQMNVSA